MLDLVPTVSVSTIPVMALEASAVVDAIAGRTRKKASAFALHIGGLNHHRDEAFLKAMRKADFVYADGAAVVILGRLAGALNLGRAATTDIGIPLIHAEAARIGRPPRLALLGGPPGLADEACAALEEATGAVPVFATHGYHRDYESVLTSLNETDPDIVVVGLGMPLEACWVSAHWSQIPDSLVLTCGGWFAFLTARERRAPEWMQRLGLEWFYRLGQSPLRLASRYVAGFGTLFVLAVNAVFVRRSSRVGRQRRRG